MALDKGKLKGDIKLILTEMMQREQNSFDEFADRLADAIDAFVKKGEVDYKGGLANSGGAVTGTIIGNIK